MTSREDNESDIADAQNHGDARDDTDVRTDPLTPPTTPTPSHGRKAPVPKQKRPGAYRVPPRKDRHGLFIINTGDGKGKTNAALGVLLRASGRDMQTGMLQFIKRLSDAGEHMAARRLGVEIVVLGDANALGRTASDDGKTLALAGWQYCQQLLRDGEFDVLILDELTLPVHWGWIDEREVVEAIRSRAQGTHVIVTGRYASRMLVDAADLVTEMRVIKYPIRDAQLHDEQRGQLEINTGDGKGKSTAALGELLRASGEGKRVGMFQFIKSAETLYGEHMAAAKLGIEITPLGDGFTWLSDNIAEDKALAERGWQRVRAVIESGAFDVLILDELTYCLTYNWLDEAEVLGVFEARPPGMHVVVTGRNASPALIALADRTTEMHLVRHPYREQGIAAQPGIEL